ALTPFCRAGVVFEMRRGRRAAEPIEDGLIPAGENVGAVITDAERNVAHQRHAALLRIRFNAPPLLMCDPLHVTEEIQTARNGVLLLLREITHPIRSEEHTSE